MRNVTPEKLREPRQVEAIGTVGNLSASIQKMTLEWKKMKLVNNSLLRLRPSLFIHKNFFLFRPKRVSQDFVTKVLANEKTRQIKMKFQDRAHVNKTGLEPVLKLL